MLFVLLLLCPLLKSVIPVTVEGMMSIGGTYSESCKAVKYVRVLRMHGLLDKASKECSKLYGPAPDCKTVFNYTKSLLISLYIDALKKDEVDNYKTSPAAYLVLVLYKELPENKIHQKLEDLINYCKANKISYELKGMTEKQILSMKRVKLDKFPVVVPGSGRTYLVLYMQGKEADISYASYARILLESHIDKVNAA
jgi:hypothetical protein